MTRQIRKYTKEFKEGAVNLALKSPSMTLTAKELGIPTGTLGTWMALLKKSGKEEVKASGNNPSTNAGQEVATLVEETRRLHKELAIVREEKEILKKAAAYFAQHQK